MNKHPLGEYAFCPWCGKEHKHDGEQADGWSVGLTTFDSNGSKGEKNGLL